jgi:uncharacterized linocin/CFP29 family protein
MAEINSGLRWSEDQWAKVNNAVAEAFAKASVAGAFLPCYGPLPGSTEYVRNEKLTAKTGERVKVEDDTTLKLFNLTVKVELSSEQVTDDALSSALLAFRRAANTLAQVEDHLVFNGRGARKNAVSKQLGEDLPELSASDEKVVVSGEESLSGLVTPETGKQIKISAGNKPALRKGQLKSELDGDHLVSEVARAVVELETDSHPGPFASVLGADAFVAAHTPATGLVLPADRITPILNGPLLRSGRMAKNHGIVVSLAGSDIDIVVATPPKVQFLQVREDAKYLFRVYEKFVLRIKDESAVRGLSI